MSWFLSSIQKAVVAALALIVASGGCIAASGDTGSICKNSMLDESAGVNFVAGLPVYVSPKSVGKLTGCQTMWDSKGRITMQIVFNNGKVAQYIEYVENYDVELICKYTKGVKTPKNCPDLRSVENGFTVLGDEIEKALPIFDDLRHQEKAQK